MANDIGGVWRTVGGRRIFIKDGQDLSSAMKESGKFNNKKNNSRTRYYNDIQNAKTEDDLQRILAEHDSVRTNTREESKRFMKEWSEKAKEIRSNVDEIAKDKKKHTIDKNDINALNELADSGKDINDYYGLDDIAKDYIKNRRQEMGRNEFTKRADEVHKKTLDEKTRNLEDGKEIHDVFRQMDAKEMEAFAKQNPESIKKMQDYLKSKKTNNDNEDKISAKQFKEASKIDEPLERAIQMQVADDVGKTLNDDDIRFRAENYIRHNYNGEASTEEIYEKLKSAYKNNGTYENNDDYEYNLYKQAKENPDSINPMTEWSTDWEDLDKRFKDRYEKENSKYKYSVDGQKITEAEFRAEYDKQKKLGNIDKDMTYDDYKQGIVDDRNSNVRSLKNDLTTDERLQYLKEHNKFAKENQKSDLMTAEQLKGKDREEQKEINKQYLKEQNKLAQEKNDANFAKEWYEGTKKTENIAKDNLERAKRNGASVEDLSNRTKQVHELELETQKAQEHANKMSARANRTFNAERDLKIGDTYIDGSGNLNVVVDRPSNEGNMAQRKLTKLFVPGQKDIKGTRWEVKKIRSASKEDYDKYPSVGNYGNYEKNKREDWVRNAFNEYKKKHPNSRLNFSKFKDNYKS